MTKFNRKDVVVSFVKEPVFYVNVEKKTVVCKLDGIIVAPEGEHWLSPSLLDNTKRFVEATGAAKCHGDDVFDVARGKRIALAKAENNAYVKAADRINKAVEDFRYLVKVGDAFLKKAEGCVNHNREYIDTLSNVENPDYIAEAYEPKKGKTIFHESSTEENKD